MQAAGKARAFPRQATGRCPRCMLTRQDVSRDVGHCNSGGGLHIEPTR